MQTHVEPLGPDEPRGGYPSTAIAVHDMGRSSGTKRVPLRDRAAFNVAFLLEPYFPNSERLRAAKQRARARVVECVRRGGAREVRAVERHKDLSAKDFRSRYLSKGIPVIFEGCARTADRA